MGEVKAGERSGLVRQLVEALTVVAEGQDSFRADSPDWFGGHVFGGTIVAQAVSAAAATVAEERRIHSLHGYFLRPARTGLPFSLRVDRVRDGRSFTLRRVTTLQEDREVFTMTCSFHAGDKGNDYQLPIAADALDPEEFPFFENPWALDIKDLGATPPEPDGTHRSTYRMWVRLKDDLPRSSAIHDVLLAYLSDMTRTGARPPSLGKTDTIEGLISLDHAVWFHRPIRPDEWLFFDIHVLIHAGGRGLLRGTMHTRDGKLGLSMAQEMLIQPLKPQ